MTNKRKITFLIVLLAIVAVATVAYVNRYVVGWVAGAYLCGIPCGSEAEEAGKLVESVAENYHFAEKSKSMPERPPIFCRPGGTGLIGQTPHTVIVYTITDKTEQDKIIKLIASYKNQKNLRHISVQFYKEENWTTRVCKDGSRGGSRGKEELIRKERL